MAIKIKKITFRFVLMGFVVVGFFAGLFSKVFLGDSVNLGKLELKSNDVFSKSLDASTPVARADTTGTSCTGDVNDCTGADADAGCSEGDSGH